MQFLTSLLQSFRSNSENFISVVSESVKSISISEENQRLAVASGFFFVSASIFLCASNSTLKNRCIKIANSLQESSTQVLSTLFFRDSEETNSVQSDPSTPPINPNSGSSDEAGSGDEAPREVSIAAGQVRSEERGTALTELSISPIGRDSGSSEEADSVESDPSIPPINPNSGSSDEADSFNGALKKVSIDASQVSLEELKNLDVQVLKITNLPREGLDLSFLRSKKLKENLIRLDLSGNRLTLLGTKRISELTSLESLKLYNCGLDDEKISPLGKLNFLRRLSLRKNQIKEVHSIALINTLEVLNLSYNPLADSAFEAIQSFINLRKLFLVKTEMKPMHVEFFLGMPRFKSIDVRKNKDLSSAEIKQLVQISNKVWVSSHITKSMI